MVIVASYFKGEDYGLLGPQMAATVIQENASCECIVVAVAREDSKSCLKRALRDYFGPQRPVVGFSSLSGRPDLFALARELRGEGALTILAGPQADVDYLGEVQWTDWPHRFKGFSDSFSVALHGPAEQAIAFLTDWDGARYATMPGILFHSEETGVGHQPRKPWEERFLNRVDWANLYRIENRGLRPHRVLTGQVLQQIGCPHAAREKWVAVGCPQTLVRRNNEPIRVPFKGCSFCDVAVDKGFYGTLGSETVLNQVRCLPELPDQRKIPFELINENALVTLPRLLRDTQAAGMDLSQINLTLRADWFLRGEDRLREALGLAEGMGTRILLSSMGFESFDNRILHNLNKGVDVKTNIKAIDLMRRIKEAFPDTWGYARSDGANHGFIHPTPWDTEETWAGIQTMIDRHGLAADILPGHSTPLIIHHASGLGHWIRQIELREQVRYHRLGAIIAWWEPI